MDYGIMGGGGGRGTLKEKKNFFVPILELVIKNCYFENCFIGVTDQFIN